MEHTNFRRNRQPNLISKSTNTQKIRKWEGEKGEEKYVSNSIYNHFTRLCNSAKTLKF